jgi:hypothetical protein
MSKYVVENGNPITCVFVGGVMDGLSLSIQDPVRLEFFNTRGETVVYDTLKFDLGGSECYVYAVEGTKPEDAIGMLLERYVSRDVGEV